MNRIIKTVREYKPDALAFGALILTALAMTAIMLIPRPAYALSIIDLVQMGPFNFVAMFVIEIMDAAMKELLIPLAGTMFTWSTDYLTIPYVNTVILGLQGIAVAAVIALRIAKGITSGILLSGGNSEVSVGEFFMQSILAIVIVAIMPLLCNIVIHFGNLIFTDVLNGGKIETDLKWMTLGDDFETDSIQGNLDMIHVTFWLVGGMLLMLVLVVGCGYQFIRRQVEMLTISLIGPLVAIYSASDNDNSQVWDLLRKLFGLCCLMWLQYLLVRIALNFGHSWLIYAGANGSLDPTVLLSKLFTDEGGRRFLFTIAFFMAALTIPNLVDQYTTVSGGSRIGGVVAGAAVTKSIGGVTRAAGGAAKAAGSASGNTVSAARNYVQKYRT